AFANGKSVGQDSCPVSWRDHRLVIDLSEKRLWEPGSPFLYDLKFTLSRADEKVDEVASYFGLRKISLEGRSALINGKRVFQRLILDQGFYPDGIWTAPSDEALRHDIEMSMAAGYNGARLHQKVFEPRFLYWADKLGYLVWGEFPNWGFDYRPQDYSRYINEWTEVLLRDRNHPSIIGWCPFNETPPNAGELQEIVWRETKAIDPTRPVFETSGWAHTIPQPEIFDFHDYNQDPPSFKKTWLEYFSGANTVLPDRYGRENGMRCRSDQGIPFMISEFGGTHWNEKQGGWGYGKGPENLEEFYARYSGLVNALLDNPDMFGFCYTQLTDVEQEQNGLYFYDRRPKFDLKRLHAITARAAAYEKSGPKTPPPTKRLENKWQVLVGAAADGELCAPYHFVTTAPATNWTASIFDDSNWKTARAPFGNALPGVRTPWSSNEIWLRRTFDSNSDFIKAALVIFYDEDTEVYVNEQKIWNHSGFATSYQIFPITEKLKKAIHSGKNTLAIHTRQTGGGQFIDLALLVEPPPPKKLP
ncbi:MAG: hypothetical protein M3Y82_12070, partial [Verrucomicrobiota bacterium]|nr:hypothetical protein [Verrucomicrobiota bacterium]